MRVQMLALFFICCFTGSAAATGADNDFILYLVRHAEQQTDGSSDPALNATGEQRSERLARWLQDKGIKDIWSSDLRRSRNTAKPLLAILGLELNIYEPRNQPALVEIVFDKHNNALIVGHSNTIPELARLLCSCTIAEMDEAEFERLIVISVVSGETQVETLLQTRLYQP